MLNKSLTRKKNLFRLITLANCKQNNEETVQKMHDLFQKMREKKLRTQLSGRAKNQKVFISTNLNGWEVPMAKNPFL